MELTELSGHVQSGQLSGGHQSSGALQRRPLQQVDALLRSVYQAVLQQMCSGLSASVVHVAEASGEHPINRTR